VRRISDHALLRFMERCCGIDVESHRRQLQRIADPYIAIKARSVPLPDGHWLLIEGETVVTVTPTKPNKNYLGVGDDFSEPPHWKALKRKRRR